jgi:dihydroxyacid dehydratase/phosphogluconate dehydratase
MLLLASRRFLASGRRSLSSASTLSGSAGAGASGAGGRKHRSHELTGVPGSADTDRSGARAFLRGAGFTDACFAKPIITVACPWSTALPCNIHFQDLGAALVRALEERGAKAFIFGTPVVADGEVQGIDGMRFSLPSRDLVVRPLLATY